jgi:hypothetical protein
MPQYNYSYSMMRAFDEVVRGTHCGILFREKYINKTVVTEATEAMKAGQYLEYLLTGEKPRSGETPQPEMTKAGKLTALYEKLQAYPEVWKHLLVKCFIDESTIETGVELKTEINGFTLKGILDVSAYTFARVPVIIDIKGSGFIRNKWEDYGWDELHRKPGLWGQLALYDFLYESVFGEVPELKFAVFAPNSYDARLFNVKISNRNFEKYKLYYEKKIEHIEEEIAYANETFWTSTSDFKMCKNCPMRENCDRCLYAPVEEQITVSMNYPTNY